MKTQSALCLAAATAASLYLLTPRTEAQSPPDAHARFAGRFRFTGGDGERQAADAAVERTVQSLSAIMRPFARPRLRRAAAVRDWVEFAFPAGSIELTQPGMHPTRSPENGAEVQATGDDGEPMHVTQRFAGGTIVHRAWTDRGGAEKRFTVSGDGATLTMSMHIFSSQLPVPVDYTLTYHR